MKFAPELKYVRALLGFGFVILVLHLSWPRHHIASIVFILASIAGLYNVYSRQGPHRAPGNGMVSLYSVPKQLFSLDFYGLRYCSSRPFRSTQELARRYLSTKITLRCFSF